jgi:hypothetical protein
MIQRLSLTSIATAAVGLLAVLFALGWLTREDPGMKPYLQILGGGFMFNYRVAEVYYGFSAMVVRPLPTGSIIEASFEDPAGGADHVVRQRVGTHTERYSLRSPPVRGVEKGKSYQVAIRVMDREERELLWQHELAFRSQISDRIVPDKPLTVGPGYHRNPDIDG